jgi:hypothetical protein
MLVRLISDFAGVTPRVAGKPQRPLLDETRRRVRGERPLMVGDRLDTDIAGAHEAETDSLLVLTGVSSLEDLVRASPHERPTWIGQNLSALGRPGIRVQRSGDDWSAGPWTASLHGGRIRVEGDGEPGGADADAWWSAVGAAGWEHLDRTGDPVDPAGLVPPEPVGENRDQETAG